MRSGWASLVAAGMTFGVPADAQRVAEIGMQALVATSSPALAIAGAYTAVRPSQRLRVALTAGAGVSDGEVAGRGELLGHFLLNPAARRGAGAYAGGGIAGVVGPVDEGYLVLLIGVETRPGAGSGWALEVGVGGGVRIAMGYRWRRHPRPRRSHRHDKRNRPRLDATGRGNSLDLLESDRDGIGLQLSDGLGATLHRLAVPLSQGAELSQFWVPEIGITLREILHGVVEPVLLMLDQCIDDAAAQDVAEQFVTRLIESR